MLDVDTGEVEERVLAHEGEQVREFYAGLPGPVRVGIEATGSMQWFLELMEEVGVECAVGHPAKIRACEPRKQKHDRRDALLLMHLLAEGRFLRIWMPSVEQRDLPRRCLRLHLPLRPALLEQPRQLPPGGGDPRPSGGALVFKRHLSPLAGDSTTGQLCSVLRACVCDSFVSRKRKEDEAFQGACNSVLSLCGLRIRFAESNRQRLEQDNRDDVQRIGGSSSRGGRARRDIHICATQLK
ncbi:MAG: hypothetical protein WB384_16085, partial [Candidatus Sulfotelmatobacter sp.]